MPGLNYRLSEINSVLELDQIESIIKKLDIEEKLQEFTILFSKSERSNLLEKQMFIATINLIIFY